MNQGRVHAAKRNHILPAFFCIFFTSIIASNSSFAGSSPILPDWSSQTQIDASGRPNPYQWDEVTLQDKIRSGNLHALNYPVETTGLLIPLRPAVKILNLQPGDPLFGFMRNLLSLNRNFKDFKGFWKWVGLHDYPAEESIELPFLNHVRPEYPMGVSILHHSVTFGCVACHSGNLFGKSIIGLTNRFPRANLFFKYGKSSLSKTPTTVFASLVHATEEEKEIYRRSRERITSVGVRDPQTLGLDSSFAQTALSLAHRALTPDAERTKYDAKYPRPNLLDTYPVDSKPPVWWNVKYKTRWLSDGSVLSGNPILTNFLWNEIGRGADLPEFYQWVQKNQSTVEELTTAVFANQAPRWKDFFGENSIQISRAKQGEKIFNYTCAQCHGNYDKAWSLSTKDFADLKRKRPTLAWIDTIKVTYFETTPVVDVGTDSNRYLGMRALAEGLNPLAFSKQNGIVIETQKGYIPPPLEGIWARYPYLHNNSIPSLCALMTPPSHRPVTYFAGAPIDKNRDYDQNCVGYPSGKTVPREWKKSQEYLFDSRKDALSNRGHYEKIFADHQGRQFYSLEQKKDLIEFLKTL